MLFFRPRVWLTLSAFISILSCTKVYIGGPAGAQGPPGPPGDTSVAGTIYGKVFLYDSLGNPAPDNSGASVVFDNSSPQISLTTQADGSFSAPGMAAGVYDITVSKSGYGSMKIFHFEHTGGPNASQTGRIELGGRLSSSYNIRKLQVDTMSYNQFHEMIITITLAHPQSLANAEVLLYISHAPGVGNNSNDYVFRASYFQTNDSTLIFSPFDVSVSQYSDKLNGIDFLYMAAAIDNPRLFSYEDGNGNAVYPAAGQLSNEVKVYNNLKD
jgi:hypothetical protein